MMPLPGGNGRSIAPLLEIDTVRALKHDVTHYLRDVVGRVEVLQDDGKGLHLSAHLLLAMGQKRHVPLREHLEQAVVPLREEFHHPRCLPILQQVETHEEVSLPRPVVHHLPVHHRPHAQRLPELLHAGHGEDAHLAVDQNGCWPLLSVSDHSHQVSHPVCFLANPVVFPLHLADHPPPEPNGERAGERARRVAAPRGRDDETG
mmetsp:Transcript_6097/g.11799  ORF Transcript_6097/g.11799 Transcript_6097/m.11799 type:complete len:204 (+) Transcript_6097:693-1304(+)